VLIDSADSPTLYMSRCCHPIPGDNVQGFFTPGKGVAVHRSGCRNVRRFRRRPKEWVAVDWAPDIQGNFDVVILCHLVNQPGALARVTATMSLMNVNIENMDFNNRSEDDISIRFVLSVESRVQLARIVRRLRNLTVVRSVKRES
jgi:(p)ppGpp synthase/HD superfamily hydrolase